MYIGSVDIEGSIAWMLQTRVAQAPTTADAAPAYRIYGPDPTATMTSGTGTMTGIVDTQTGLYKATHACPAANGYASGKTYFIRMTYTASGSKVETYSFMVT